MTVSPVYTDRRGGSRPYTVTVRSGCRVNFERFAREADAEQLRERLLMEGAEPMPEPRR